MGITRTEADVIWSRGWDHSYRGMDLCVCVYTVQCTLYRGRNLSDRIERKFCFISVIILLHKGNILDILFACVVSMTRARN